MNRRVLLIMPPNDSDFDSYKNPSWSLCRIPPIGLLSIENCLKSKGYEVEIADCRNIIESVGNEYYLPQLMNRAKALSEVVGINVLTANFNQVKRIAELIKNNTHSAVILGGVHPSVEPELTLKQIPWADAVCIGDGEEVMLEVAEGQELDKISGLKTWTNEYVSRQPEKNIDKYPFPDYSLANEYWYSPFSTNTITGFGFKGLAALTSRSCPYSCSFCASDWSKPFRYHSAEYVIGLAKHLAEMDIDVISFFDDTIAINEQRLFDICEGFIREKIFWPYTHLRWIGELRANQVKPELLVLMKRAGCFHIGMGIESGSDRMLEIINKKVTVEENRQACRDVKEAGLSLGISFMMGIPSETETDMRATLAFMKEINCNYMGVGSFRPLPGSKFFNELITDKENIDWSNLGNFMLPPKYKFYNAPESVFNKLYDEAYNYAYGRQWVAVHEDTIWRRPIVNEIAKNINVKVCEDDDYYSDNHRKYKTPLSINIRTKLEALYMSMPYKVRNVLKTKIKGLTGNRVLARLLWRYA